jgi:hypothetical protein
MKLVIFPVVTEILYFESIFSTDHLWTLMDVFDQTRDRELSMVEYVKFDALQPIFSGSMNSNTIITIRVINNVFFNSRYRKS